MTEERTSNNARFQRGRLGPLLLDNCRLCNGLAQPQSSSTAAPPERDVLFGNVIAGDQLMRFLVRYVIRFVFLLCRNHVEYSMTAWI